MFSKIKKKLKKRYEPKEKDGKVLFRQNNTLAGYVFSLIVFFLIGFFFLLLSWVDTDFAVAGLIFLAFGLLFIGFIRMCETAFVLDQDHLEIYALGIHWKIYYRDIKYVYKSAKAIVIEYGNRRTYMIDARLVDSSFETYFNKYLRCCNQKVRKTVPSPEELKTLHVDVKTDFYCKRIGERVIWVLYLCGMSFFVWIFHDIDLQVQDNQIFVLVMVAIGIALFIAMTIAYSIRYHFTETCIEQKILFLTLERVYLQDISIITKKTEYIRISRGNNCSTEMIHIYCNGKECFKNKPVNSVEFYNFSDVLIYFNSKNIKIQELR